MSIDIPSAGGNIRVPKLPLLKLRVSMVAVWMAVVGTATLLFTALILYMGLPSLYIYGVFGFVLFIHLIQWLLGPKFINAVYKVKPADGPEYAWLNSMVENLAVRSGLKKKPKVMIANIEIPNAFAYGSPLTGPIVAVTQGLLGKMPRDELEAVMAHEVGHLKHKDVVVMLMISLLPAVIYYIGYTLYFSSIFGGYRREGGAGGAFLVGIGLMILSFIFNIFVFYMSRLREYYADSHAALTVENGARRLQRALARIMALSGRIRPEHRASTEQLKMFFISDPETAIDPRIDLDRAIEEIKNSRPSPLADLFSTHPHPTKRFRHLDKFAGVTIYQ